MVLEVIDKIRRGWHILVQRCKCFVIPNCFRVNETKLLSDFFVNPDLVYLRSWNSNTSNRQCGRIGWSVLHHTLCLTSIPRVSHRRLEKRYFRLVQTRAQCWWMGAKKPFTRGADVISPSVQNSLRKLGAWSLSQASGVWRRRPLATLPKEVQKRRTKLHTRHRKTLPGWGCHDNCLWFHRAWQVLKLGQGDDDV